MKTMRWLVDKILSQYNVHAIILFGSRARGDWLPSSDYDILIVADFDKSFLDRSYELTELIEGTGLAVEFHPYTLEEVKDMLSRGVVSIVDALEEGVTLYESSTFKEVRDLFKKMKERGLRRSETSLILPDD